MAYNIAGSNVSKAGLCPHGLPFAACPICSGGGGGGIKKTDRSIRRNPGEMTWNECYFAGQMMKAAQERKNMAVIQQQAIAQNIQAQQMANRLVSFISSVKNFVVNNPVVNTALNIANKVQQSFAKFTNVIANFAKSVSNFANNVKNVMADISDKIAALFGEEKLAKLKNVHEFFERNKKKILVFFGLVSETNEEKETSEEVKKEEKKISFIQKLRKKFNFKEEGNDYDS